MKKNNHQKILTLGLFLISLFALPNISNAIDIPASASRTSGVAPLSVHFNADLTASSPTERSFHDLEYSWNFGDTDAGVWGTDNKPKNEDKGPISAHVYETPGTFTTTLTVRNATGIIDTKTFEITVTDPDVVFAGALTTCISTNTDFTGCPVGATQIPNITTSLVSILPSYADAGERVLLRRGSTWNISSTPAFPENNGAVQIGAFGNCASPDELGICSNTPIITLSGSAEYFIDLSNKRDWRVTDISFTGSVSMPRAIFGIINLKDTLVLRVKIDGFNNTIEWTHWRVNEIDYFDNNAVVSSRMANTDEMVVYLGSERLAVLGNIIQDSARTHVLRVWGGYLGTISHNILSGSSLTTADGRDALKLHGPAPQGSPGSEFQGTFAETGNGGVRNFTKFVLVANNVFGTCGPWPVSAGPQNDAVDERLSDIIFEKNKFLSNYGNMSVHPVQVSLMFEGRYFTVRNNIMDGTGGANDYWGVFVWRRGVEWTPLGNEVYNNTMYSQSNHGNQAYGVEVHADADATIVRNNLVSFPNTTTKSAVVNGAGVETIISNNILTDTPFFVDPNNVSPLLRNFSLTSQSTQAINQGITVPVFDDFAGQSRTGAYDIGAYEYLSGGDMTAPSAPANLSVL